MDREQFERLLPDYLENNLAPQQEAEVRAFLQTPEGRRLFSAYEESWALLDQWPDEEPEPGYVSRFWSRFIDERALQPEIGAVLSRFFERRLVIASVMCVIFLVAAVTLKTTVDLRQSGRIVLTDEQVEFFEDMELAEHLDLLNEIDLLEEMDIIEQWDGSSA